MGQEESRIGNFGEDEENKKKEKAIRGRNSSASASMSSSNIESKGLSNNNGGKLNASSISNNNTDLDIKLAVSPGMFVSFNKSEFSERYRGIKMLGKGSFGQVILCADKVNGQQRAVKVIRTENSEKSKSRSGVNKGVDKRALRTEVELLKTLDHPNIMKLYEFYEDTTFWYIVTEVYSGGELFDEILKRKRFNEVDAAIIIKQILSGITYMHKHNVVHRDLKPENILLESKEKNADIKIIDFGLSTYLDALKGKRDKLGTAYYIAPEILTGLECTEKCDVWSTGVILYILLSGCPPFGGQDESQILSRVKKGTFTYNLPQWSQVSDEAKDLINQMLTYSPKSRCSAKKALDHIWIRRMTNFQMKIELPCLESSITNIRQFQGTQKLARAALLYMGANLTSREERKSLLSVFRSIDTNHDGQLDREELIKGYKYFLALKGAKMSDLDEAQIAREVDHVLKSIDFDRNGYIEYSEFVTVAMDRETLLSKDKLTRAFNDFDKDGSGRISLNEAATLFGLSGEVDKEITKELLRDADKNNDGEIDFEEFQSMIKKLCGEEIEAPVFKVTK